MSSPLVAPGDCWFLTGPTASGKTAVGLALAQRLGAEIISLDSMALYRGMDIGTAKPTIEERRAVRHHLIDVIEPDQEYSLAQYVAAARDAVRQIADRGRVPLFVGGTPLYLKSLLRGIFSGPPADWDLRRRLQAIAQSEGAESVYARLTQVDARSARRLHPRDTRRVIRALEVWEKTGQSITDLQRQFDRARPADQCRVFTLRWPKKELLGRIDARVDAMFAAGLLDEVRALLARTRPPSHTAAQAVGYREAIEHFKGVRNLPDTIALVKLRTRQFAKRQLTWFRSLSECRWVDIEQPFDAPGLARRIAGTEA
ncbi:MAG: tRNA (adenosine(37)-N6)-dimethylallyltransferase MiaA [Planctomycetia bacterium]|nr:tRNA (adenosine(37)-N6)-dimethylallyltransferase MiaA [Planctomycetia bacterium]